MKYFRDMSITKKMILICMNICLIPLLIGFIVLFQIYITRLNEHTMEFAQAFNAQITANLNHMLRDYEGISVSVLVDNELFFNAEKEPRTVTELVRYHEKMQRILFRIVTLQPKVKTAGILMQDGDLVQTGSNGLRLDPAVFREKPWVKELEQSAEYFYLIPAHRADYWNHQKDELTITFVRRIMSSGARYCGALLIDIDPASIIVLNEEYEHAKQKYDIEIRIADSEGYILYDTRLMEDPAQWQDGCMTAPDFGSEYIVLKQQADALGLTVYTAIPRASLELEQRSVMLMTALVVLLCGGSVAILVVPASRTFTKRFVDLSYGMSRMKKGEYITLEEYKSKDEMGVLVDSYNHMVNEMQQLIDKVYIAEIVKKDSEIIALQSQINPHMLFNTLEAIRMKSLYNGDKDVSRMIFLLAKMFRTVLDSQQGSHMIRNELEYAEEFMSLQNLRSGNRFCFEHEVDESLLEVQCIPVLFQPLIENCIEHGQREGNETLKIRITGKREGETAVFRVYDDGKGMDEEQLCRAKQWLENARRITGPRFNIKNEGFRNIGLKNILMRLRLADEKYGDLDILYSNAGGTCIELRMNAETGQEEGT